MKSRSWLLLGIVLLAIGSIGIVLAVFMEYFAHAKIWQLLMKICPWLFGMGCFFFALGYRKSKNR